MPSPVILIQISGLDFEGNTFVSPAANITPVALDMSRIEQGRFKYSPEDVNIVDVLNDVVDELEEPAKEKGLELKFKSNISNPDNSGYVIQQNQYIAACMEGKGYTVK